MGGGTLLLAVLINLMPITKAMVFHGVIQFFSNGFRSALSWRHIQLQIIFFYLLGTLISGYFILQITFYPNKPITLILLGLMILVGPHLKIININVTSPRGAFLCGLLIVIVNTFVGVSGPLLNMFFLKSSLNRHQIIATKSFTQTTVHIFKVIFYSSILTSTQTGMDWMIENPILIYLCIITFFGGWIGKKVVNQMSEKSFKLYGNYIISIFGLIFIGQGLYLLFK